MRRRFDVEGVQNETLTPKSTRPSGATRQLSASRVPLVVSLDPLLETCSAMPFGGPAGLTVATVAEGIDILADGLTIRGFRSASPNAVGPFAELDGPWHELTFYTPTLLTEPAPIVEILLLAYATFGTHGTADVMLSWIARGLAGEGDLDGAIEAATWSLAAGHPGGHLLLGGLLLASGRPVDAYGHLRTHASREPDDPRIWIALGRACEQRGDQWEARRAYLRALEVASPGDAAMASDGLDRLPVRALWEDPWR